MHAYAAAAVSGSTALVDEWFGPFCDLGGEVVVAGIAAHALHRMAKEQKASYRYVLRTSLMRLPANTTTTVLLRASCGQGAPLHVAWRVVRGALWKNVLGLALKPVPGVSTALRISRAALAAHTTFKTIRALEHAALAAPLAQSAGPEMTRTWPAKAA
jgi:hypothetical protein